jgi:hypothetical protein
MGWAGYNIYDGDGTQSCHEVFIRNAKIKIDDDIVYDWMSDKTTIPEEYIPIFIKNQKLVIKKIKKYPAIPAYKYEDTIIEWQMLLALYLDNYIKPPRIVMKNGINSTKYLMLDHADEFTNPSRRKRYLEKFIKRAKTTKFKYNV